VADPGVVDFTKAAVFVPDSDAVILSGGQAGGDPIAVTPRALYLRELVGGPSRVAIFDHADKPRGVLPIPAPGSTVDSTGCLRSVRSVAARLTSRRRAGVR
jgi:hypothetical protein